MSNAPGLDRESRREGSRRLRLAEEGRFLSDAVGALTLGRVEGLDSQTHFLAHGGAEEAADRMCLPGGGGHQLRERSALRPADQCEHRGLLAAVARHGRFRGRRGPGYRACSCPARPRPVRRPKLNVLAGLVDQRLQDDIPITTESRISGRTGELDWRSPAPGWTVSAYQWHWSSPRTRHIQRHPR